MKSKKLIVVFSLLIACLSMQAQVKKQIFVKKAGDLISNFTLEEANQITHLIVTGKINAIDFKHLRDEFNSLEFLDLTNASIRIYAGKEGTYNDKFYIYPPNCIPAYAFCKVNDGLKGKSSLKHVILSEKTKNIEDFAFKNCDNLEICEINRKKAPNLMEEALNSKTSAIFIPLGCSDTYRRKKGWKDFAFVEGTPVRAEINVGKMSTLEDEILKAGFQPQDINFLTVNGKLDEGDFKIIRNYLDNLVYLDISNTTPKIIPEFTFAQKKYMMHIILPKNLETIKQRAFSGCGRLQGKLKLPNSVNAIEYGAFMGCDKLEGVYGKDITTIGQDLFGKNVPTRLFH